MKGHGSIMRRAILDALRAKYEAEIAEADAIANIYLENSVGIGEHPQHLEEVDKQIASLKINSMNMNFDTLKEKQINYFNSWEIGTGSSQENL